MKIRFIQTLSTQRECFVTDREYDIPDAEAQSYIRAKVATDATGPTIRKKDKTAEKD